MTSLLNRNGFRDVRVVGVENRHFGGNTSVAGLLTGVDIMRTLETTGPDLRYLIPDVCLNGDRFLDDVRLADLEARFDVEVVRTSGADLRRTLDRRLEEVRRGG